MIKRLFRYSGLLLFVFFCIWTVLNLKTWGKAGKIGHFSTDLRSAEENHSIIAIYRSVSGKTFLVERMEFSEPWKYIYYSPHYFSDDFYVDPASEPPGTEFIINGTDTVASNGVHGFRGLPSKMELIEEESGVSNNYYLWRKYSDNIETVASVSLFRCIDSGPLLNDE